MYDTDVLDEPTRPIRPTARARRIPAAGSGLQLRLNAEWEHLRRRPDALATAESWRLAPGPVHDLDHVLTLVGYDVPRSRECDEALAALVRLARTDVLATRVVLQRVMPGLLARGRIRRQRGYRGHVFEELVSAAWIAIRSYDPARRPSCLAAALIDGADYWAFGRAERLRTVDATTVEPAHLDRHVIDRPTSPCDELAALVDDARADGVTDEELEVVIGLVHLGSPTALAATLGVTTRTVRNRRDRVTERMRRVALAA